MLEFPTSQPAKALPAQPASLAGQNGPIRLSSPTFFLCLKLKMI